MGVLERFFHITLMLTLILFAINFSLVTFGYAMTGDDSFSGSQVVVNTLDLDNVGGNVQPIQQVNTQYDVPATDVSGYDSLIKQAGNLFGGYRIIIWKIFADIEPANSCDLTFVGFDAECADTAEKAASMLLTLILMIQFIGFAYLPWALISAWKGGGSP